jgi:hypothetical protein
MCHKYGQWPSDVVIYGRLQEPFGFVHVSCRHLAPYSTAQHSHFMLCVQPFIMLPAIKSAASCSLASRDFVQG